jgi:hypothetical protein
VAHPLRVTWREPRPWPIERSVGLAGLPPSRPTPVEAVRPDHDPGVGGSSSSAAAIVGDAANVGGLSPATQRVFGAAGLERNEARTRRAQEDARITWCPEPGMVTSVELGRVRAATLPWLGWRRRRSPPSPASGSSCGSPRAVLGALGTSQARQSPLMKGDARCGELRAKSPTGSSPSQCASSASLGARKAQRAVSEVPAENAGRDSASRRPARRDLAGLCDDQVRLVGRQLWLRPLAAALCSGVSLSESHHGGHSCREAKDHTCMMPARPAAKQLRSLIVR